MCEKMAEKLVSMHMCEQQIVNRFLNVERKNRNEIQLRQCNVYTKATSQFNLHEWIKKFNKWRMELQNKVGFCQKHAGLCAVYLTIIVVLTISNLHHEIAAQYMYVNVSRMSIYQILINELEMTKVSVRCVPKQLMESTTDLPQWLLKDFKYEIFEHPPCSPPLASSGFYTFPQLKTKWGGGSAFR